MNLQEITGQESGIFIYKKTNDGIICNWSGKDGIPAIFANELVWYEEAAGEELKLVGKNVVIDDMLEEDIDIIYDGNEDIPFKEPDVTWIGNVYESKSYLVLAPRDWS